MPLAIASWGICSRCASALLASEPLCPRCGLPAQSSTLPCGRCLQKPPPWQRLVTVNDYRPPLSGLIHQLKFNKRPELAPALARLLLLRIHQLKFNKRPELAPALARLLLLRIRQRRDLPRPDRIIGVPLWQRRQWKRGFNQSDLLCRPLSRWLDCAWRSDALTRRRRTATQHQLSARLRKQNLKNAFQLELSLQGHHIAIVDDVVTTGSTVAEISRLLLRNGAATVQVWCICRTL